jgi:hypothetical protein
MTEAKAPQSSSDILRAMKDGAKLYRGFADKIELTLPDGRKFEMPTVIFDGLIDENRIVPEHGSSGFYRLA